MTERIVRFPDGQQLVLVPAGPCPIPATPLPRLCFAAAHVVMSPEYRALGHRPDRPGSAEEIAAHIDLDATMAVRRRIGGFGFGIAEAMDTAQRFEIGWPAARRLIEACGQLDLPGGFVAGAGCDQLPDPDAGTTARIDAIVEQVGLIQAAGGAAVLLPQPWLCQQNLDATGWVEFYQAIIAQSSGPLIIHWLGEMFHQGMAGAFPGDSFTRIMQLDPDKVRGCKLSLLDAEFEMQTRADLRASRQLMLTGDDFHFGDLILGDGTSTTTDHVPFGRTTVPFGEFSHALLGILDGIARPAASALTELVAGDVAGYRATMQLCEHVGQVIFEAPTQHYKAGLALLAWLNGWQEVFSLPNGAEHRRDLDHLRRVVAAASAAGVLEDIDLAAERLESWIAQAPGSESGSQNRNP